MVPVRPQRSIETIALFDQWSGTIENHWKQWKQNQKPLKKNCGDFHTVKWCKESIDMVHIKWTLWILIYLVCKIFVFCCKLILKALFRFNGTSKPSLTIALKILKTIEKPLIPMVGPSKNIQWWWSNVVKTIEKPLKSMVAWKKNINHSIALKNWPSSWSNKENLKYFFEYFKECISFFEYFFEYGNFVEFFFEYFFSTFGRPKPICKNYRKYLR